MDKITLQNKTVEDAIKEGLELLGAKREDVIVHVLDEGQKGFLGLIGNKDAKVLIIRKDSPEAQGILDNELELIEKNVASDEKSNLEEDNEIKSQEDISVVGTEDEREKGSSVFIQYQTKEEACEGCRVFLEEMMHKMGYPGVVETIPPVEEDENFVLDMIPDDYKMNSRFIGKKGETLSTIGYLVNVFLRNRFKDDMMIEVDCGDYVYEKQEDLKSFARMAADRALNEGEYVMRPMNAYDRRIVHKEVAKIDGVTTHSEGEEPRRRIIVTRDPQ